jgi:hypothetical protein
MGVTHTALPELALRKGITTSVQSPACEMPECCSWCQHFGQKASGNIVACLSRLREWVTIQMVGRVLVSTDEPVSLRDMAHICNLKAAGCIFRLTGSRFPGYSVYQRATRGVDKGGMI